MDFESLQNNGDVKKSLYNQVEDAANLANQSVAEYLFGKAIDILLEQGFHPSEIVQAFTSEISKRIDNPGVTIYLESASSALAEYESFESEA